jgi:hypothetical protein
VRACLAPEMVSGGRPRRRDRNGGRQGDRTRVGISPLLADVYLHYCFDLRAARWRRHEAAGDMIVVRFADDLVVGFEKEGDARRFLDAMRTRF